MDFSMKSPEKRGIGNRWHVLAARLALAMGRADLAEKIIAHIKAKQVPYKGVDYLRAICFIKRNAEYMALSALREELRYFPNHEKARALLADLDHLEVPVQRLDDPEFKGLVDTLRPYTMLSEARLWSLYHHAKDICQSQVPGNFVECGVAAGGSSALLSYIIHKHSKASRLLYSFDSFEGMPQPSDADRHGDRPAQETGWGKGTCAAPVESLMQICRFLGSESVVRPVKGLFHDTLPLFRQTVGPIAFLHLDADWYDSTMAIWISLYDQVVEGGFLQIDDYGFWEGCRKATREFFFQRGISPKVNMIDETGACFFKSSTSLFG